MNCCRNLFLFFSLMVCMLGSISLHAHDAVITDDQVFKEMITYLIHLNGENSSKEKMALQLDLLRKIKALWKIPEFRNLRQMSLETILTTQRNNPYFLTALAFHNEDLAPIIKKEDPDLDLFHRAMMFKRKLKDGLYTDYFVLYCDDIGFDDENPEYLLMAEVLKSRVESGIKEYTLHLDTIDLSSSNDELVKYIHKENYPLPTKPIPYRYSILHPYFYLFESNDTVIDGFYSHGHEVVYFNGDDIKADPSHEASTLVRLSPNQTIIATALQKHNKIVIAYNSQNPSGGHSSAQTVILKNKISNCGPCDEITAFEFSPDSNAIITGNKGGDLNIHEFSITDGSQPFHTRSKTLHPDIGKDAIGHVGLHPNHTLIAYAYNTGVPRLFDLKSMKPLPDIETTFPKKIHDLLFTPTGELLVGDINYLELWDVESNQKIQDINLMDWELSKIAKILLNQSGDYLAILFEGGYGQVLRKIPKLDLDALFLADPDKISPK